MQVSHSRIETFGVCPFKYKLRYLDKLNVLPRTDDPSNALTIGVALHDGIENGVKEGLRKYFESFPVIDDLQINEAIKLNYLIPKVQELIPEGAIFEEQISDKDFVGFIDMLVPVGEDGMYKTFDLYDFKYSNHVDRYMDSPQLSLYKYFYERTHPFHKIRNLAFIFVPKTQIRQKKTEDLAQFRRRLLATLETLEIQTVSVEYDPNKVIQFLIDTKRVLEATEFPKNECKLCDFCDYKLYCQEGVDYMLLPSTARRSINVASRKKIWIYGAPFSGKTTFADQFPTPIMLNTDGNTNSFTAPCVEIREEISGRQTIPAWAVFKDAIETLQKGSEFETIVVDLVEDTFEHCRLYCYDKLGIEHESDNSFKAWDYVRTEFLSTMKRLMTLDYNIVLISHEDMSKDITKRSGDKITAIKPNIQEKTALKLAGMVDIVIRAVKEDEDEYTMQFKGNDVVFGGGRLKISHTVEPLSYEALEAIYEAQGVKKTPAEKPVETEAKPLIVKETEVAEEPKAEEPAKTEEAERPRRRRRTKAEMEQARALEQELKEGKAEARAMTKVAEEPKAEETPQEEPAKVEEPKAEEPKPTFDDLIAIAKDVCGKYGQAELIQIMAEKFGISKFVELKEDQYAAAIAEIKAYATKKEAELF